jgi:hypothetical protein
LVCWFVPPGTVSYSTVILKYRNHKSLINTEHHGHTNLFNTVSKSTSKPGTAKTTKWVARARLSLTFPPPMETSSFNLLNASPNRTSQSGFLQTKVKYNSTTVLENKFRTPSTSVYSKE